MLNRLKYLTLTLLISLTASLALLPVSANADFKGDACSGINSLDGTNGATCPTGGDKTVTNLLKTIVNLLSAIVGVIAVIMVIVGGFKYVTSGGDSSSTASARNTIIYALVGLLIAVVAQVLIHFVLFQVGGVKACATNGSIPATSSQCK